MGLITLESDPKGSCRGLELLKTHPGGQSRGSSESLPQAGSCQGSDECCVFSIQDQS